MNRIELLPAFWWSCPRCKQRNTEIPEIISDEDMDSPEFQAYNDVVCSMGSDAECEDCGGIPPEVFIKPPVSVFCDGCFCSFPVSVGGVDIDEEDMK